MVQIKSVADINGGNMLRNNLLPTKRFFSQLVSIIITPLLFLLGCVILGYTFSYVNTNYALGYNLPSEAYYYFFKMTQIIVLYWIFFNIVTLIKQLLTIWARENKHSTIEIIFPPIINSLRAFALLTMVNMLIPLLNLQGAAALIVDKSTKIFAILTISWVIYQIIISLENYIINFYVDNNKDWLSSRKINTQLIIVKRLVLTFLFVVTIASILMLFEGIKNIGSSLLITAGIVSSIGAFASQQSLGRVFSGLQLAFTQPVRIGDTVVIDNEFGQIEEISLSFIIVKLWDFRRLILPTEYFTQKGILNLTRQSSELLGTIYLYTDYTLPVDAVRSEFLSILQTMSLWNQNVANLDVTDIKEHTMELRCLVSANNAGDLWKLRCELREKLIQFIVKHFPECLSKTRQIEFSTEKQGLNHG